MINVLTVHFNTPEMMTAAIKSLNRCTPNCRITVFDNSNVAPFVNTFDNVEVIDNTRGQVVDFDEWLLQFPDRSPGESNFGSPKHTKTIDYCFDLFPEGFILMDSDVLFKKDITPLWNQSKAWVGEPFLDTPKGVEVMRLLPFLCYINVPMCKRNGIKYFNSEWMWKLQRKVPNTWYDTGAWFYKACMNLNLPHTKIKLDDYIVHYFHGSHFKLNSGVNEWLNKYSELWK